MGCAPSTAGQGTRTTLSFQGQAVPTDFYKQVRALQPLCSQRLDVALRLRWAGRGPRASAAEMFAGHDPHGDVLYDELDFPRCRGERAGDAAGTDCKPVGPRGESGGLRFGSPFASPSLLVPLALAIFMPLLWHFP